jgi:hypothetical protein
VHGFTCLKKELAYKRLDKMVLEDKIREEERKKKEKRS